MASAAVIRLRSRPVSRPRVAATPSGAQKRVGQIPRYSSRAPSIAVPSRVISSVPTHSASPRRAGSAAGSCVIALSAAGTITADGVTHDAQWMSSISLSRAAATR